jgi:hypothetical protein
VAPAQAPPTPARAGKITLKQELYELQKTANKRKFIYDSNGKVIDTEPFIIND